MVSAKRVEAQVNSYIGMLSHGHSYRILKTVLLERNDFWCVGDFVYKKGKWCFKIMCDEFVRHYPYGSIFEFSSPYSKPHNISQIS